MPLSRHHRAVLRSPGFWAILLGWTLLAAVSLWWQERQYRQEVLELARSQADGFYWKIYAYRHWNAKQGGVYVPLSDDIQPNPYLERIPERDVVTPSGRTLTLVNPAYMLRTILDGGDYLFGQKGHLTSLKPINPANRPDLWEESALQAFAGGSREVSGLARLADGEYFRLMRPLAVEAECLRCHAQQGYKVGDIRGGLSASVPMAPLWQVGAGRRQLVLAAHLAIWLVGFVVLYWSALRYLRHVSRGELLQQTLEQNSQFDRITNLPKLPLLVDRLRIAIEQAHRHGEHLAVVCIDLDHFKRVNNSYGHALGDDLIRQVALRLRSAVREGDTLARFGGDSFVLLLTGLAREEDVGGHLSGLLETLAEPFTLVGDSIFITASFGASLYPADGVSAELLLQHADTALHEAKQKGRNTYHLYTAEMQNLAVGRIRLENEIRSGLQREEFELYYQPQIDVASGLMVGVEALVRWRHPDLGLLLPSRFIPLAEETGLIVPLGEWVIRQACRQIVEWDRKDYPPIKVAVNLAPQQLRQPDFIARLTAILAETGAPAQRLSLEITESAAMHEPQTVIETLLKLKELGFFLAIDDFGSGYSSLNYLKLFPIDLLKIDRSFVTDLPDDANSVSIVEAIIAMAASLNLRVLAEGAENELQRAFLARMACHEIQGYCFSPPLPAALLEPNFLAPCQAPPPAPPYGTPCPGGAPCS